MASVVCVRWEAESAPSYDIADDVVSEWEWTPYGARGDSECVVEVVSRVLKHLCEEQPDVELDGEDWLRDFTSEMLPTFGLRPFIAHLARRTNCASSALVVALIYLDRLNQNTSGVMLSMYTVHRLFLTALMLACKFLDDRAHRNYFFAQLVGSSYEEMNELETAMLGRLNFKLFVDNVTYDRYASCIFKFCGSVQLAPIES